MLLGQLSLRDGVEAGEPGLGRGQVVISVVKAMLADGLTLADVVSWTDGETTLKEATRLADLASDGGRS